MDNGSVREGHPSPVVASAIRQDQDLIRNGRRFMIREPKSESLSSASSSSSKISIDTVGSALSTPLFDSRAIRPGVHDPWRPEWQTHRMDIIAKLPVEISLYILSFLDGKDLLNLAKVSTYWNRLAYEGSPWQMVFRGYESQGWNTMENVDVLWKRLCELFERTGMANESKCIFNLPKDSSSQFPIGGQVNERIRTEIHQRDAEAHPMKFYSNLKDFPSGKNQVSMEIDPKRISGPVDWYTLCKVRNSLQTIWGLHSTHRDEPIQCKEARPFGLLQCISTYGDEGVHEDTRAHPLFISTTKYAHEYGLRRSIEREEGYMPEVRYLKGHQDSVYCIRLDNKPFEMSLSVKLSLQEKYKRSPLYDENASLGIGTRGKIFSGSRDRTIRIWDGDSGLCLHTLEGHTGSVLCLDFDDDILLSGSSDSSVVVWDLKPMAKGEAPTILKRLKSHTAGVLDLSMTERYVISCGKDALVRVYDRTKDFEIIETYSGHPGPVNAGCISFFEGALHAVTASGEGSIHLWELLTGTLIRTFQGHTKGLACVKFSGNTVISGSNDHTVRVWDAKTGKCLVRCDEHSGLVRAIAYDDKRKIIVSAGYDGRVKLFDVHRHVQPSSEHIEGGNVIGSLTDLPPFKHSRTIRVFDVEMDGTRILSSGETNNICVRDFTNGNPIMRLFA